MEKAKSREFIAEHKRLVNVLRHPAPAKLKREAKIQAKELHQAQKSR